METAPVFVGVDVSKDQLDVAVGMEGPAWTVTNDDAGIGPLLEDLSAPTCELVVLEASGGFEVAVTTAWPRPACRMPCSRGAASSSP